MSLVLRLLEEGWFESLGIDPNSISNIDLDRLSAGETIRIKSETGEQYSLTIKDDNIELQLS